MSTQVTALDAALEQRAVDTIRFLAVDAVERAKSGHPGMPMGMADVAYLLWTRYLRYQPQDPTWPGRDRFVLSAGHGSMLLYAMLHLTGYDLPMEQLMRFRRLGSRTPGHPEYGVTPGVETTTGPLGQGLGNAVGMALAGRMLSARFATAEFDPAAYRVFGICGDGDLMEGVASEAASLAGHWALGNLIFVYDQNHITIEGDTELAFTENVGRRFEAYGWHVDFADAQDRASVTRALDAAVAQSARPSLVIARSTIAYGAPHKAGTAAAHGEPLGSDEALAAKHALGWPEQPPFLVPDEVRALFAHRVATLRRDYDAWQAGMKAWRQAHPERAAAWDALVERHVPSDAFEQLVAQAPTGAAATRAHGNAVLQLAAARVPALVGGAADLEPSTKTAIKGSSSVERGSFEGRNFHFGVREHGMASIANGLSLSGFIPYGASFLIFTDYARPAIRLSALMRRQVIWVFTHDSVFLGEDGPTHEPIEQLASLRAIPNLLVIRPADGIETAAAWGLALERRDGPTLIALTRQSLPAIDRPASFDATWLRRGGYVLRDAAGTEPLTLIATGSEVSLAVSTAAKLESGGPPVRVVSMPSPQLFLAQDAAWRDRVLPAGGRRVSIEAGSTVGWDRIVGERGYAIGIDRFGESAPLAEIQEYFGFTPEKMAARITAWLGPA